MRGLKAIVLIMFGNTADGLWFEAFPLITKDNEIPQPGSDREREVAEEIVKIASVSNPSVNYEILQLDWSFA